METITQDTVTAGFHIPNSLAKVATQAIEGTDTVFLCLLKSGGYLSDTLTATQALGTTDTVSMLTEEQRVFTRYSYFLQRPAEDAN